MPTGDDARDSALGRVVGARSGAGSIDDRYRDWAARYDHDVFEVLGVTGSRRIADVLAEHIADRGATVIDLGCGTGAVGQRLRELGFDAVDGIDLSPEMLAVAAGKECYRWTGVCDLSRPASLPDRTYAAAVSAGTFTSGHVGPAAVPSLIRLVDGGGLVAWVIAEAVWPEFDRSLTAAGVECLSADIEPIRTGGPPESVMFVGRVAREGPPARPVSGGR